MLAVCAKCNKEYFLDAGHSCVPLPPVEDALRRCVEASGEDLDGNSDDVSWLVRHGESCVRTAVQEYSDDADKFEEEVLRLQEENRLLKHSNVLLQETIKKFNR